MDTAKLLDWYKANKRDLPWRKTSDVYAVLVSEMMLQQTTVETVLGYYARFLERFPDVTALAAASEEEVLDAWKGLGYYSRARNLHRLAKQVAAADGAFPETLEGWRGLPGVGPYIAGAVTSIALGLPCAAVDGNVLRVFSRVDGIMDDIMLPQTRKQVEARVQALMPRDATSDFTQALMELGALVCRPVSPDCAACPVADGCVARERGIVDELPVKKPKEKQQVVNMWVVVAETPDAVLLEHRRDDTLLARMWGLPNVEKQGDRPAEELLAEKYGIRLMDGQPEGHAVHVFTHRRWEMDILRYRLDVEIPVGGALEWVSWEQFERKPVPTAFMKALRAAGKEDRL
jgi:A/G-specific adenine glycosylase